MTLCIHCEQPTRDESTCDHCSEEPLVDGRYRVLEKIGQGANGATYRAARLSDGKIVALKELLVRHADSLKTLELFEREAETLRQLDHPNIPRYYEDFAVELGPNVGMYLAQQYLPGQPLSAALERGAMPSADVIEIVRQVVGVLEYLHGLTPPVVHRDIKPANLIRAGGRVALIDFGSVEDVLGDGDGVPTMAGTMGYMAAEQFRGISSPASDIYALGITAIALVSGEAPTQTSRSDWSLGLPTRVRKLFKTMVAVRPENRPSLSRLHDLLRDAELALQVEEQERERRRKSLSSLAKRPRPIPANFEWGQTAARGAAFATVALGLLFAAVFAASGVAILVGVAVGVAAASMGVGGYFFYVDAASRRRTALYTDGEVVVGKVLGVAQSGAAELNNTVLAAVLYYEFETGSVRRRGEASLGTTSCDAKAGEDVVVFFNPSNPSDNRVLPEFLADQRRLP